MKSGLLRVCSLLLFSMLITFSSCLKDKVEVNRIHYTDADYAALQAASLDLPRDLISYQVELPRHMISNSLRPPAISDAKATLGRVLFYDKKLSQNNTKSCASKSAVSTKLWARWCCSIKSRSRFSPSGNGK